MPPTTPLLLTALVGLLFGCVSTTTRPLPKGDPGSVGIASLEKVRLGGVDQWILIRGTERTTPLILKIHGGPGQAEMATVGTNAALEQDFVVVEWDQRGAGKSAAAQAPTSAMTLDHIADDAVELTRLLLHRFHKPKLILVGHDWGSVVGLKAVQRAPELYSAFVATGLDPNPQQAGAQAWQFLVDEAARRTETQASRELAAIGPPPYEGPERVRRWEVFGRWVRALGASWHPEKPLNWAGLMAEAPEYSWWEKQGFASAAARSWSLLEPDWMAVDLMSQVPRVSVPVFVAAGRWDHLAPPDLARGWFDALQAPRKTWRWFENSAHFPMWEESGTFELFLEEVAQESGAS